MHIGILKKKGGGTGETIQKRWGAYRFGQRGGSEN